MATGTGKTAVAFQICWKLWTARWNPSGEHRKPKILFLADRNILVNQPKDGLFAQFARRPAQDRVRRRRERPRDVLRDLPGLAGDANRAALYREYPQDFFDLIIVDDCHRGSARERFLVARDPRLVHHASQLA